VNDGKYGEIPDGKGKGKVKTGPPEPLEGPDVEAHKIFVGSLPKDASEVALRQHFVKFGQVQDVKVPHDPSTGSIRGFAFVTLSEKAVAKKILENYDENEFQGKWVPIVPVKSARAKLVSKGCSKGDIDDEINTNKLWVGSLHSAFQEESIKAFFTQFGAIDTIQLTKHDNDDGFFRSFAFVTFMDRDAVKRVLDNYEDNMYAGQWLECKPARTKDDLGPPDGTSFGCGEAPFEGDAGRPMGHEPAWPDKGGGFGAKGFNGKFGKGKDWKGGGDWVGKGKDGEWSGKGKIGDFGAKGKDGIDWGCKGKDGDWGGKEKNGDWGCKGKDGGKGKDGDWAGGDPLKRDAGGLPAAFAKRLKT